MLQRTLAIVKPDGVANKNAGNVIARIEKEGFRIVAMRQHLLSRPEAEGFYAVHRERPFFKDLVAFMTSGPVVLMCLERDNAIGRHALGDEGGVRPHEISRKVIDPGGMARFHGFLKPLARRARRMIERFPAFNSSKRNRNDRAWHAQGR